MRRLLLLLLLLVLAPAGGAGATVTLTREDARAFADSLVPTLLARAAVAGAAVVVVKDGEVVLSAGYGTDGTAPGSPVDPDRTLFRVGSVSKLLTWVAVMQLAEEGRLDLDADIRAYLPRLPLGDGHGRVTLRHLMTHRAGFEEVDKFSFLERPGDVPGLEDLVLGNLPRPLYPPGTVVAYSNYGAALAGLVVEAVAGQRFEDRVRDRVLAPLGMSASTFEQPVPPTVPGRASRGFVEAQGPGLPPELVGMAPAGALSATPADMGRFMAGLLAARAPGGSPLLRPGTVEAMWTRAASEDPWLRGMGLGFIEQHWGGVRAFGHGGSTPLFHASLTLYPDLGLGLFVATNSLGRNGGGPWLRRAVTEAFNRRYLPPLPAFAPPPPSPPPAWVAAAAGPYRDSRWAASTFLRYALLADQVTLSVAADGTLSTPAFRGQAGEPLRWYPAGDAGRYVAATGARLVLLREGDRVVGLASDAGGQASRYIPVHGLDVAETGRATLLGAAWLLLAALPARLLAALAAIRRGAPRPRRRWLSAAATLGAGLAGAALLAWHAAVRAEEVLDFSPAMDATLSWLSLLTLGGIAGAALALADTLSGWRDPALGPAARLGRTLLALGAGAFLLVAWHFNLMAFDGRF